MATTKVITIRRDASLFLKRFAASEVHPNVSVIIDLKAEGVPVIGAISIAGVRHGKLEMFIEEDLNGDEMIYRWTGTPDAPAPKPGAQVKAAVEEEEEEL